MNTNVKSVKKLAGPDFSSYLCIKKEVVMTFKEIQEEIVKKYRVTLVPDSKCHARVHAHVKSRKVCKWKPKSSFESTFTLLHEVGHIETTKSSMRRAEEEYYATCWAIDRCREYGLTIPERTLHEYQRYILQEVARGKRRGGSGYGELNIYRYAGVDKSIEQFKTELSPEWAVCINPWV